MKIKKIKIKTDNKGQSLIELLLVMILISVVMTAAVMLVMRALQLSETSLSRQRGVMIAKATSEYLKKERELNSWSVFKDNVTNSNIVSNYIADIEVIDDSYKVEITNVEDNSGSGGGVLVEFEIGWTDVKGNHEITDSITLYP